MVHPLMRLWEFQPGTAWPSGRHGRRRRELVLGAGGEAGDVLRVQVRWYYQPWQTKPGSRTFHGKKELHLSDRIDTRSAYTFEAKCVVHTLKEYSKLSKARIEDFFCRLEYKVDSATFMPDQLSVYCICEMPYNPDIPMISCPGCKERLLIFLFKL
ncbi:hypothetical protein HU200_041797 [Digitaria exilis]|uniref:BAH domain-containing protein n=1 Tax=Digitaria exilis TaxID=1010633 RepID=A0A835EGC9_9POAL|nr:hypothetical protein HU200_041797 [Digitaria exilis]